MHIYTDLPNGQRVGKVKESKWSLHLMRHLCHCRKLCPVTQPNAVEVDEERSSSLMVMVAFTMYSMRRKVDFTTSTVLSLSLYLSVLLFFVHISFFKAI